MRFALALGDEVGQALPLAAAANESFKRARRDCGDDDFSAVYEALRPTAAPAATAVCFDFDGTLGDTETPAMEVAFWEIAAYLPGASAENVESQCRPYMVENAGKAFEHMMSACEEERAAASLPPIAEAATALSGGLVAVVDKHRSKFGLPPLADVAGTPLLQLQKEETVAALAKCAVANEGVMETLVALNSAGLAYNIATTSGKPRVPVCVDAASLRPFFPAEQIHSGESDFDPPRFKPEPDVYLRAAAALEREPTNCIAVEDSGSGVGSASNAGMGLIVGYVGATHIPAENKESHAQMLLEGAKAKDGRGAEIVITKFGDLVPLAMAFEGRRPGVHWFTKDLLAKLEGPYYLK
mmetsp:Transcript_102277/g.292766  ORF Transcript_102277/g.292766 Transcript_102277/m.292766 type:complete len:355 (+) Transcript_102277:1051-2115(+)